MPLPAFRFATAFDIRLGRGEAGRAVVDLAQRVPLDETGLAGIMEWAW